MGYVRGAASDYDGWEALGNKGWSFNEVLPLIRKVTACTQRDYEIDYNTPCSSKRLRPYQTDQPMVTRVRSRYLPAEPTLGLESNS